MKRNRWRLRLGVTCVLLLRCDVLCGQEQSAHPQGDRLEPVHELLADHVAREQIAGAVGLVIERGRVVYRDAVGWRDVAARAPMTADTIFRMASMTKPITSTGVMMLVEEGRLRLDDPLSKFIPEFAHPMVVPVGSPADARGVPAEREITIHDLLTHTSGITYGFFGQQPHATRYREAGVIDGVIETPLTLAEDVQRLAGCPLTSQPGAAWQYGLSTDVLGRVIEVASGKPLDEFLEERIFRPLGMDDTYFFLPENKVQRLAALYRPGDDGRILAVGEGTQHAGGLTYSAVFQQRGRRPYCSGGGGLVSTAGDYARFLAMLLNRGERDGVRLLNPETVELMTGNRIGDLSIQFTIHGEKFGYGFGIHSENSQRNGASVGTWSWGGVFCTYFWVDPQRETIGIVLTQLFPFNHLSLWGDFQQRIYDVLNATETSSLEDQIEPFSQQALTHGGNPDNGRRLFLDRQRTKCDVCHRVNGEGGQVGPDLTSIGGKFDRPHLIESLLEPSRQIVEGYRTTALVMTDGRVLNGVVKERDESQVTLLDADNQSHVIRNADVESSRVSDVSIMPLDLPKALSVDEFTDLVAWLETLRPGGQPKPGAGITGPIMVPEQFDVRVIATGISGATAMEVLPDGRVLVCEQPGAVRVVENGRMLDEPFVTLPVESDWERGVIGVTVNPDFPRQPYVYACRVAHEPYPHHIVSRFTADGNVAVPGSEQVLLAGDDQRQVAAKVPGGHQGGAIHFGLDGKLYVGIGEHTAETPSQELDSFLGKILRINPDGSIPDDNPFVDRTEGKYRAIWARGLRNPFTFAFNPRDGMLLINDVGGKFEEINVGRSGGNYGWPVVEHGPLADGEFIGPIYWYPQSSIGGGDFIRARSGWPTSWDGLYFFADFVQGWIKTLDPRKPESVNTFATGLRRPVDLRFAPDGSLYVLLRNAWVIDDKFEGGTGSLLQIQYGSG